PARGSPRQRTGGPPARAAGHRGYRAPDACAAGASARCSRRCGTASWRTAPPRGTAAASGRRSGTLPGALPARRPPSPSFAAPAGRAGAGGARRAWRRPRHRRAGRAPPARDRRAVRQPAAPPERARRVSASGRPRAGDPKARRRGGQVPHPLASLALRWWQYLAGIQQVVRIEGQFEPSLQLDDIAALLAREKGALGEADSVLPRDRPAQIDGGLEHLFHRRVAARALLLGFEEQIDMQVAVAGMSVARRRQAKALTDGAHPPDQLDEPAAGDGDVLADLVRPDGGEGNRDHPPRFPDAAALGFVLGGDHLVGAGLGAELAGLRQLVEDPFAVAVVLDDERPADAFGELERRPRADRAHRGPVEQLAGPRQEARAKDLLDRERGLVFVREESQQRRDRAWKRDELQRRFDDHRQRSFAPDEELGQV